MARTKKKSDQPSLPGEGYKRQERPEIESLAESRRALTGERASCNEKLRVTDSQLAQAMHNAGLTMHRYLDADQIEREVSLEPNEKIKITRPSKPAGAAEGAAPAGDDSGEGES